jgi:hypothetical protein
MPIEDFAALLVELKPMFELPFQIDTDYGALASG